MPKFKIVFQRNVVETDEVVRVIEAPNEQLANEQAALMCDEFDRDCPGDTETIAGGECQDWFVNYGIQVPDDTPLSEDEELGCELFRERVTNPIPDDVFEPVEWPVPTGAEVTSNGLNEALAPQGGNA